MKRKINNSPYTWDGKNELKENILYTKYIVRILNEERDKWHNESGGKRRDQFNRNLNYYKQRVDELNAQWKKELAIAMSTPKQEQLLNRKKGFRWDE